MPPTTEQQAATQTTETPATPAQPTTPAPTPTAAEEKPVVTFTQADVDRIVKERIERESKKADKEKASAEESARLKALEESGEHKKLADERALLIAARDRELAEAKALAEQGSKATAALTKLLEAELAGVPEHIKTLMANLSPADQLTWLAENKAKLAAPTAAAPDPKQAKLIPGTPKGPDAQTVSESELEKQRAAHAKSVRGMF